jgi:quercetin dioxygenase-like cupin family protein
MKLARTAIAAATIVLAGVGLYALPAQQPDIRRIDVQRHDLAVPGYEVVQVRVEIGAGAAFGRHHHPGDEIVNVLEGTLEYVLEGQAPVTLRAGEALVVPAGVIHSARNRTGVTGAELATYIVPKGKPLLVMAD